MPIGRSRRDEVPLGIESALPGFPEPAKRPERPRAGLGTRLLLAAVVLAALLGIWRLGQGLYAQFKAPVPVSQAEDGSSADERDTKG